MDLGLSGKTAVVTGASKGIGLAVTRALAAEGVSVVMRREACHRGAEAALCGFPGAACGGGPGDGGGAGVAGGGGGLRIRGRRHSGQQCGGGAPAAGGFLSVTDEDWISALTINFLSAVRTTRAALPHLVERGAGSIVTVCSVNSFLPDPGVIDYCASKAALANFSKALSKEVGPQGVRVNTVSPGPVETDLWLGEEGVASTVGRASGSEPGEVVKQVAGSTVTGRFTRPEEVADLVLMLAGERAGNVTGADFVIDGGLTTTL